MRPIYWKLGATLIVGALTGFAGGQATIAGLIQPPPAPLTLNYGHNAGAGDDAPDNLYSTARFAEADAAEQGRIASACDDCSDYDLGFRFAASRRLTSMAECMDYSWSYQRGCLAYLRDG